MTEPLRVLTIEQDGHFRGGSPVKPWVAEIVGLCPRYGLRRDFIRPARGEHRVESMSEIVRMLYQAGWRDEKIREELGMDIEEVRRLKQITGLAELFRDREFSEAWEPRDDLSLPRTRRAR